MAVFGFSFEAIANGPRVGQQEMASIRAKQSRGLLLSPMVSNPQYVSRSSGSGVLDPHSSRDGVARV